MKLFHIALIAIVFSFSNQVKAEPAKAETIQKILEASDATKMASMVLDQMIPLLKRQLSGAPEDFWIQISQEFKGKELMDMVVPVYQKHLTESDAQAIYKFYMTPAGQRLIKAQPLIVQETMMLGQQWGQQVAQKIIARHQAMQAELAKKKKS